MPSEAAGPVADTEMPTLMSAMAGSDMAASARIAVLMRLLFAVFMECLLWWGGALL